MDRWQSGMPARRRATLIVGVAGPRLHNGYSNTEPGRAAKQFIPDSGHADDFHDHTQTTLL